MFCAQRWKKWGPKTITYSWPPLSCKGRKLTEENVIPNKALSLRLLVSKIQAKSKCKRRKITQAPTSPIYQRNRVLLNAK